MKTAAQQLIATGKSPKPKNAKTAPTISAKIPDQREFVASIIAGKVITERVT